MYDVRAKVVDCPTQLTLVTCNHCDYFLFPDLSFRQIPTIWTQYLLFSALHVSTLWPWSHAGIDWKDFQQTSEKVSEVCPNPNSRFGQKSKSERHGITADIYEIVFKRVAPPGLDCPSPPRPRAPPKGLKFSSESKLFGGRCPRVRATSTTPFSSKNSFLQLWLVDVAVVCVGVDNEIGFSQIGL